MARFDRLEFGAPDEPEKPAASPKAKGERASSDSAEPKLRGGDERQWLKEALTNRRKGQYENALRYYSRALEENKALVGGWVGQVQMLILLDEVPEADLWVRKALEIFPGNGELFAARAQALCRLGNKKEAAALCDAAMSAQGRSAYRWQARGELMLATRQTVDAHCFDKAQEADRDWLVPTETALIYLFYKKPSQALARARVAVETGPDQFYAWYVRGCAEAELDFRRQATESFEHCLKLSPRHADAMTRMNNLRGGWSLRGTLRRLLGRG